MEEEKGLTDAKRMVVVRCARRKKRKCAVIGAVFGEGVGSSTELSSRVIASPLKQPLREELDLTTEYKEALWNSKSSTCESFTRCQEIRGERLLVREPVRGC